jgi:chemotaxis protein MotB
MKARPSQAISRTPAPPNPLQARAKEYMAEESNVRRMMQKLESLEHGSEHGSGHTGHNRWMVPYADLLTLLLGLFLVLFTSAQKPDAAQTPNTKNDQNAPVNTLSIATTTTPEPSQNGTLTPEQRARQIAQAQAQQRAEQNIRKDAQLARQLTQTMHRTLPNMQGIEVHQQMRGVVVSMKDNILFAPGSAELSPAANQTLSKVVRELHTALGGQPRPIRVEGHTDNTPITNGKFPSNWELSTARATAIVRHLASSGQFRPQLLSAVGYGEFRPLKDNSSIEGKRKNRRVDIVVLRPDMTEDMTKDMSPDLPSKSPPTTPRTLSNTTRNATGLHIDGAE